MPWDRTYIIFAHVAGILAEIWLWYIVDHTIIDAHHDHKRIVTVMHTHWNGLHWQFVICIHTYIYSYSYL